MRRTPLALLLGAVMIASPLVAAAANLGGGQTSAPTIVTLLSPLVNLPATVVSLDFIKETNGKVKHSSSSDENAMKFAAGKAKSVAVHLQIDGPGIDLDSELSALIAFAKGADNKAAVMTLVWGHLGAFDVTLEGLNGSAVNITHDPTYQHNQADLNFLITDAGDAQVPRDFTFTHPDLGVHAWLVDFDFTPTVNWSKHRESRSDTPDLEFSSGAPRSMSFELMFDMYEEGTSVKPAVDALLDKAFTSTSQNATGPVEFWWGDGLLLRGFLVNVSLTYTMFQTNGEPVRVSAHGNLSGLFPPEHKGGRDHQVQGHSPPPVRYHPGISMVEPPVGINATLIAMNAWINATDEDGDESVDWQDHRNAQDAPPEFKAGKPMNMSVELMFDGYEENVSVKERLAPLAEFVDVPRNHKPPVVTFAWGRMEFMGVLESLRVKYTLFLPDGTPVRATTVLEFKNASQTQETHARLTARGENGTRLSVPGTGHYNPGKAEVADITLIGMITGDRAPMVDWMFGMANGTGSSLRVALRFRLPSPSAGAWACTQVTYTPQQFSPQGATDDKITVHAQVLGLKQGETPTFGEKFETQRCTIDAAAADDGSHRRQRSDGFAKATGFTVEINGSRSGADTFEGGEVSVALEADQTRLGHYKPGKVAWGVIRLARPAPAAPDWGDWYNLSQKTQGGLRLDLTVNCTDSEGQTIYKWSIFGALPTHWSVPTKDSDKSGMPIERINITVEKVERA